MNLSVEVACNAITALSEDALGDASAFRYVVDLRKAHELTEDPSASFKERNIQYYRMPVSAADISEQDLDHLRRELARSGGPYAVVSGGGKRAAALVLMHAGRTLGWSVEETLSRCPELGDDPILRAHIQSYLERHRDRAARHWSRD
ncbi:MAG: hypothetical protein AB1758_27415 [Candidatus Eremiobacterota bacterium]